MPVFKEYTATGKLTPVDMGFTAFETAARRQQSVAAEQGNVAARAARTGQDIAKSDIEQAANAVAGAKGTALAWDGLKFGLDELEMVQKQQDRAGPGGVKQGSAKVERTLTGTGTGGDTNWNARANASNDLSRGMKDAAQTARALNNRIAKPLTAADGIIDNGVTVQRGNTTAGEPRTTIADANPQLIPSGPGDINLRALQEFGVNPQKQIIAVPLGTPFAKPDDNGLSPGNPEMNQGEVNDWPSSKSGSGVWDSITNIFNRSPAVDNALTPSGFDKAGIPFYGTKDQPKPASPSGITPIPADPADATDFTQLPADQTVPDTSTPLPDASAY